MSNEVVKRLASRNLGWGVGGGVPKNPGYYQKLNTTNSFHILSNLFITYDPNI
jgi:hypothetical protein